MLLDGTVQAASTHVPDLFLHKTLKDCLEAVIPEKEQCNNAKILKLCMDNIHPKGSLFSVLQEQYEKPALVVAAIGSERGWTQKEREMLESAGYLRVGMGPRVMRTETAATVSASIISACMGWME